jgi:D-cysteine desulfhydrase family pyridoxal phosphate-dependent enzyme
VRLATLARYPIATLPTPLHRACGFEKALGPRSPRIYLKRDDLTGFAFGGNKVRKLEYLLADALAAEATVLVSEGAAQSNHARVTAAAAAVAGLRCVLVLDARHGADIAGNLLLDHLFGAEVRIVPDKPARTAKMTQVGDELRAAGARPYLIPTGGSVPLGAAAYVATVLEVLGQLAAVGEAPRRLYTATGSLGTQSGLIVGARAYSASFTVYGVAVERLVERLVADGVALANATAEFLDLDEQFAEPDIVIDGGFIGAAYGVPTDQCLEAIQLLARTEAIVLDPVYSGKAMAALIAHVRAGALDPDEAIIFLHTGGGPSVFPFGTALLGNASTLP